VNPLAKKTFSVTRHSKEVSNWSKVQKYFDPACDRLTRLLLSLLGNDFEIFTHERTIGHTVFSPEDTKVEFMLHLCSCRLLYETIQPHTHLPIIFVGTMHQVVFELSVSSF